VHICCLTHQSYQIIRGSTALCLCRHIATYITRINKTLSQGFKAICDQNCIYTYVGGQTTTHVSQHKLPSKWYCGKTPLDACLCFFGRDVRRRVISGFVHYLTHPARPMRLRSIYKTVDSESSSKYPDHTWLCSQKRMWLHHSTVHDRSSTPFHSDPLCLQAPGHHPRPFRLPLALPLPGGLVHALLLYGRP
jgi:hypothetical protein